MSRTLELSFKVAYIDIENYTNCISRCTQVLTKSVNQLMKANADGGM